MVRNFYVSAHIDGRETDLGSGPRRGDGGMRITLTQRNEGAIEEAFYIVCNAVNGKLFTDIYSNGQFVARYETKR